MEKEIIQFPSLHVIKSKINNPMDVEVLIITHKVSIDLLKFYTFR